MPGGEKHGSSVSSRPRLASAVRTSARAAGLSPVVRVWTVGAVGAAVMRAAAPSLQDEATDEHQRNERGDDRRNGEHRRQVSGEDHQCDDCEHQPADRICHESLHVPPSKVRELPDLRYSNILIIQ